MATDAEYQSRISEFKWNDLVHLWKAIEAGDTPDWDAGKAFEYLVLQAFKLEGAHVFWPYSVKLGEMIGTEAGTTLEQIDGFVHTNDGLVCLLECKDTTHNINIMPIAKLHNQLLRRPSTAIGIVFSRSGFTEPASRLAQLTAPRAILLWSGDEVGFALQEKCFCKGLTAKYRVCVAKGISDYNILRISHGVEL